MEQIEAELLSKLQKHHVNSYLVAFSGGMDSHVLLYAVNQLKQTLGILVRVAYIDHGLQAESASWGDHCAAVCDAMAVPFQVMRLSIEQNGGESLEAVARDARYAALNSLMEKGDVLLTAHHQDDQAETVILQLLRGAGPAGLAAMPEVKSFSPGLHMRPLLGFSRLELQDYAERHQLRWIEDTSNQSDDFDRNYLRNQVMPLIKSRWPSMAKTFARSASHCAESSSLLSEEITRRLVQMQDEDPKTLPVSALNETSENELKALIKCWVQQQQLPEISHRKLAQVRPELLEAGSDRMPLIHWKGAEIRRYRDRIYLSSTLQPFDDALILDWDDITQPLSLPSGLGTLRLVESLGGLSADKVANGCCEIRFRQGGERIQPAGRGVTISLKQLFQELGTPPWVRSRIPLVFVDGKLAAVSDTVVDQGFVGDRDEITLKIVIKY